MDDRISLNQITKQATIDFSKLLKKSWTQVELNHKRYTEKDARFEFFANFSALNLWLLIHLDTFSEMLKVDDPKIARYMKLNEKSRVQYLNQHDTVNRTAYVTKAMFDVEDFIKKLMKGLENPPKGKYFDFTKDFLKILGMNNPQKHKILNVLYQVRNSLHNNGHVYHDFEISLRGRSYEAVKGERLDFAGWNNLYVFFDELLDLLIEIIHNPKIQNIAIIEQTSILES